MNLAFLKLFLFGFGCFGFGYLSQTLNGQLIHNKDTAFIIEAKRQYLKENNINSISKIEKLKKESRDNKLEFTIYNYELSKLFKSCDSLHKADLLLDDCIENWLELNQIKEVGTCYFDKGVIASKINDSNTVLENLKTAADCYDKIKYFKGVTYSYLKLGIYFSELKNFRVANQSFQKALVTANESNDSTLITLSYLNFGHSLLDQKKYNEALKVYFNTHFEKSNFVSRKSLATIYNNLAIIYEHKELFGKAEYYLKKSILTKKVLNDFKGELSSKSNLFNIYIKTNQLEKAKQINNELDLALPKLDIKLKQDYYFNLFFLYSKLNLQAEAIHNLDTFFILKDSLSNIAFSDKLVEMQKSFEIKERDKNIALLQKEDELKEARLNNQFIVIVSISMVVLVLIVLGYFINRQRLKLKKSECELKKQQDRIQAMNDNLDLSNQAKDRILSIIGHDLRGPIGGLKELIDLYVDLPTYEEEDFKSLIKAAREASTGSYHLLENLLTWANSQRGQINFMPVNAPLYPLVKQCVDLLDSSINTRHVGFKFDIHPNLKLTADLNMIRTVVRNLVSNAVKYSPPESCVTISAVQNNVETLISITDSGYGMSADQAEVLFTQKETYYIEAGYNAKGTGLGLILCREFVERHNGRIWADSKTNKGTQVCFTIPRNIKEESSNVPSHKNSAVLN
nr:ATP-binding protein [uncultured Carboxylicivirga sp.]